MTVNFFFVETDDSRIFTHKNGLLSSANVNNYPALQYQAQQQQQQQQVGKYPYMLPQQPIIQQQQQQSMDEQIYQQPARNEWPQMPQQQLQPLPPQVVIQQIPNVVQQQQQQSNSIWPEKLPKQIDERIANHKKEALKDLEYSQEDYSDGGEENQAESNAMTTTEIPKKVNAN